MNHSQIVSFIWGVADLIRDTLKRGNRTALRSGSKTKAIPVAVEQDTRSGNGARRLHEIVQRHVESGGETLERLHRSGLHAALDGGEVGARDARGDGQRAGGHAAVRAPDAHGRRRSVGCLRMIAPESTIAHLRPERCAWRSRISARRGAGPGDGVTRRSPGGLVRR